MISSFDYVSLKLELATPIFTPRGWISVMDEERGLSKLSLVNCDLLYCMLIIPGEEECEDVIEMEEEREDQKPSKVL